MYVCMYVCMYVYINLFICLFTFGSLLHINRRLFPMLENFINGQKESEVEEDEGTKKISMEITKQQEQIKFLQKTVEEQSRLLQEISHQLKQTAHSTATAEDTRL